MQKQFLRNKSNGSNLSTNSKERVQKLLKLQVSYNTHLKSEGFFTMKFQLEYIAFSQLVQSGYNLNERMEDSHPDFRHRYNEVFQDPEFLYRKTLCIDIMSTFITKVDISNVKELDQITKEKKFKDNYILVKLLP